MKSQQLAYWSRGVMGGTRHGVRESRRSGVAGSEGGAGAPRQDRETGASGQRWFGRSVPVGHGALELGNWTGFSRHFPDDSMQVVAFPHLRTLSVFWRGEITAEAPRRSGGEPDRCSDQR